MAEAAASTPIREQFMQSITGAFGTWNQILVFVFAALVILVFVADRYNRPTYSKERDGFVALIAPRFLTSDVRYAQGLRIYAGIILLFYVFLVVAGEKVTTAILGPSVLGDDKLFFPLAIALFIIGLSSAEDKGIFGSLELHIRRFAHQRAYIPNGTRLLARRIAQDYFGTWQLPAQKSIFDELMKVLAIPQDSGTNAEANNPGAGAHPGQVTGERYDKDKGIQFVTELMQRYKDCPDFLRAGMVFRTICEKIEERKYRSRFISYEDLSDLQHVVRAFRRANDGVTDYRTYYSLCRVGMALRHAEDFGLIAPDFAEELASTLNDVKTRLSSLQREVCSISADKLAETLRSKNSEIIKLRNDLSILLAGALMRSRPSDSQLTAVLDQIGLEDEGVPMRRSWLPCIGLIFSALTVASLVYYIICATAGLSFLKWIESNAIGGGAHAWTSDFWTPPVGLSEDAGSVLSATPFALASAIVVYSFTAIVGYAIREGLLDDGEWRENAFSRTKSALQVCATTIPVSIVFNFLALTRNDDGAYWIVSTVLVSASISILASIFFFSHMKVASKAVLNFEEDGGARPRNVLALGVKSWSAAVLHAMIAGSILFSLTYFNTIASQIMKRQTLANKLGAEVQELATLHRDFAKGQSADALEKLPPGYLQLIEDYDAGSFSAQLEVLRDDNFSSLIVFEDGEADGQSEGWIKYLSVIGKYWEVKDDKVAAQPETAIERHLSVVRNLCATYIGKANRDQSKPPGTASFDSCYQKLRDCLGVGGSYCRPDKSYGPNGCSVYVKNLVPLKKSDLVYERVASIATSFAKLDQQYSYIATSYGKLKRAAAGMALSAAASGTLLAFVFSIFVVVGRRYEMDDFYSGLTRLGRTRLLRRIGDANWLENLRKPSDYWLPQPETKDFRFALSLAEPRGQLFELSIQESMMAEGSYLRLQDQFWLVPSKSTRGSMASTTQNNAAESNSEVAVSREKHN